MNQRKHPPQRPAVVASVLYLIVLGCWLLSGPVIFGREAIDELLFAHPAVKLSETTWRTILTEKKGSTNQLQSVLHITVEYGVTKSVEIKQSTGYKTVDDEIVHWVTTQWRFQPSITGQFDLPVSAALPKTIEPGPAMKASKSELTTLKDPDANKLIVRIDVDHGRVTNVSIVRSTGNPKLDSETLNWVKKNWVPGPDQTGSFQFPVVFRKGG